MLKYPKRFLVEDKIKKIKNHKLLRDKKLLMDIRHSLYKSMMDSPWYLYCQECKKSWFMWLELHHIIFRSECPNHPKKHSKINSLLLCNECHKEYHSHKSIREKWIVQRKLWEVFPEIIKKKRYCLTNNPN